MKLLDDLHAQGFLRPLDLHFARWLVQQQANAPDALVLLAALVSQQLGEGHVCIHLGKLELIWSAWPGLLRDQASLLISSQSPTALLDHDLLGDGEQLTPLVLDKGRLYLYRYWQYECQVAKDLLARAKPVELNAAFLKDKLDGLFGKQEIANSELDIVPDGQRVAAAIAVLQSMAIISGGPGTGKTTTITRMLAIYLQIQTQQNPEVTPVICLAAPTGKAAARLSESISMARDSLAVSDDIKKMIPDQGTTLHRLLGARPGQTSFKYNVDNPLHLDLLVVDEASMIDLPLMANLLLALPEHARLILIGDKEQLASVEAGSVLGDVCSVPEEVVSSETMATLLYETCHLPILKANSVQPFADSVAFLKHSYRFSKDSGIGALASAVNAGDAKQLKSVFASGYADLQRIPVTTAGNEQLIQHMLEKYRGYLGVLNRGKEPAEVIKQFSTFRVLCGLRKGIFGVEALNIAFEKEAQNRGFIQMKGRWYSGRPVMITRNDRSLHLYNGDIGIALEDTETGQLKVWFEQGGELVSYSTSRLPQHETVFAMTVHKSQGSEFDDVTLVLAEEAKVISRELVYTGITRAKKHCALYGSLQTITASIEKPTIRMSGLAARIWGTQ
ncbi:MAG: exodeoxyribonuclease V subunit alpha [Pseudomonadales bacterium]